MGQAAYRSYTVSALAEYETDNENAHNAKENVSNHGEPLTLGNLYCKGSEPFMSRDNHETLNVGEH